LPPAAKTSPRRGGPPAARRAASWNATARVRASRRCLHRSKRGRCATSAPGRPRPSVRATRSLPSRMLSNFRFSGFGTESRMTQTPDNAMLTELGQRLVSGSLSDAAIQAATEATPNLAILPWVNVVKIGGQSIMDRGRSAVGPVVDEIVANLQLHKMILGTGAGTRARHVYSLAIDLGLPVGVLTVLGTAVAWQNAQMLQYL